MRMYGRKTILGYLYSALLVCWRAGVLYEHGLDGLCLSQITLSLVGLLHILLNE